MKGMSQSLFVGFALAALITMVQITSGAGVAVEDWDEELVYQPDLEASPLPFIAACNGKTEDDKCQYAGKDGNTLKGKCVKTTMNLEGQEPVVTLFCATGKPEPPTRPTRPPPSGVNRPFVTACNGKTRNDACQYFYAEEGGTLKGKCQGPVPMSVPGKGYMKVLFCARSRPESPLGYPGLVAACNNTGRAEDDACQFEAKDGSTAKGKCVKTSQHSGYQFCAGHPYPVPKKCGKPTYIITLFCAGHPYPVEPTEPTPTPTDPPQVSPRRRTRRRGTRRRSSGVPKQCFTEQMCLHKGGFLCAICLSAGTGRCASKDQGVGCCHADNSGSSIGVVKETCEAPAPAPTRRRRGEGSDHDSVKACEDKTEKDFCHYVGEDGSTRRGSCAVPPPSRPPSGIKLWCYARQTPSDAACNGKTVDEACQYLKVGDTWKGKCMQASMTMPGKAPVITLFCAGKNPSQPTKAPPPPFVRACNGKKEDDACQFHDVAKGRFTKGKCVKTTQNVRGKEPVVTLFCAAKQPSYQECDELPPAACERMNRLEREVKTLKALVSKLTNPSAGRRRRRR